MLKRIDRTIIIYLGFHNLIESIKKQAIFKKLCLLNFVLFLPVFVLSQTTTTFTATLGAGANWTTASWTKSGGTTNATYPGQTGYFGENAGDIHNVVINTNGATAYTLTLNANITNHIGDITINNIPGVATLAIGGNTLTVAGNLSGAGTITFSTGTLNIKGNLNNTGTFTCGTGSVNINGTSSQTVGAFTYNNLTIGGSGTKTAAGSITINGTLTLQNVLEMANNTLGMALNSAFAGTFSSTSMVRFSDNGFVNVATQNAASFTRTFPIGTSLGYMPFIISGIAGTDLVGNIYIRAISTRNVLLSGSNNALNAYWNITPAANLTITSVSGSLTYPDAAIGSSTESNYTTVGRFTTLWNTGGAGVSYNLAANTINFTNANILGSSADFTIGEASAFGAVSGVFTVNYGNWNTASTWSSGAVPNANNVDVYIRHNITLNASVQVRNLNIIGGGMLDLSVNNLTVNGTTNIEDQGTLSDASNGGSHTFVGTFNIKSGGTYNPTDNSPVNFRNGIVNYGKFNKTGNGTITFNTNNQTVNNAGSNTMTMNGNVTNSINLNITNTSPITFTNFTTSNPVTINGTAAITFNGNYLIQGAISTTNNNSNVTIVGTLDANSGSATWINSSGSTLNYQNATRPFATGGILNVSAANNTVNYNGITQSVAAVSYNNLTLSGSDIKSLAGTTTVNGTLSLPVNVTLSCGSNNLNLLGPVSYTAGSITTGANTVTYNSSSAQDIIPGTYSGSLNLQGSGAKSLRGTTTSSGSFTLNADLAGGSSDLNLNGSITYTSGNFSNTSNTVTYGNTGNQNIIPSASYYNLTFSGAGSTKTLLGDITTSGILTLNTGSLVCNNNNVFINGEVTYTSGSFTHGSNTVTYGGSSAQDIIPCTYNNLTITNTNTHTLKGNTIVNGMFRKDGGSLQCGTYDLTLSGGNNTCGASVNASSNSTVTYAGSNPKIMEGTYYNLVINGTGTATMCGDVTVNGIITLNNNLNTNGYILTINGTTSYTSGNISSTPTGTVNYTYAGIQTVLPGTYQNLSFSGSGNKNLNSDITINGNLTISGSAVLATGQYSITGGAGALVVGATAGFSLGTTSSTNNVSFPSFASNTLNTGSTITYQADAAQVIKNLTYSNLIIGGGSSGTLKTMEANTTINGTLTLNTNGSIGLGNFDLIIGVNGTTSGTFSSGNMLVCNGSGKLTKNANSVNDLIMTYPVGTSAKFTPMTISGTVGGSGSGSLSVCAISGNHPDAVAGTLALSKYWRVATTGITLNSGDVSFTYHGTEVLADPSALSLMQYTGSLPWNKPSSTITPPTITASLNGSIAGDWTATSKLTLYSYKTGNWHTANTWTTDPSGTQLVNSRVPQSGDKVVILNSYTVTLAKNDSTTDIDVNVESGGVLDMSIFRFVYGVSGLSGTGIIKSSYISGSNVGYFPSTITNSFVNAGGGTYIFEGNSTNDFTLPSQATYNILRIDIPTNRVATLTNDLTINGNLYVDTGKFSINDATDDRRLYVTVLGDVEVSSAAQIGTGQGHTFGSSPSGYHSNTHQLYLYGNFTNKGSVRFTNLVDPLFNAFPANNANSGAVTVWFKGSANNKVVLNGTTDFYNLIVDKGSDNTYILEIASDNIANFKLFGKNNNFNSELSPYSLENPEVRKALWIKSGTLKLTGKINIPTLSEGAVGGTGDSNGDWRIGAKGKLWIASPDVSVSTTSTTAGDGTGVDMGRSYSAVSLFGTLQITDGYFTTNNGMGIVFWNGSSNTAELIIEGGTCSTSQFWTTGGTSKGTFYQSGGTLTIRGSNNPIQTDIDASQALFSITNPNCSFTMSGGVLEITNNSGNTGAYGNGFCVLSSEGNYSVTGGTLRMKPNTNNVLTADIYSTINLWNLEIDRTGAVGAVSINLKRDLTVSNDITINDNTTLDASASNYNINIGGNLTIGTTSGTSTARLYPRNNTITFDGNGNSTITVSNSGTSNYFDPYNLIINKNNTTDTLKLAFRPGTASALICNTRNNFTLTNGAFDYNSYNVDVTGNLSNNGIMGVWGRSGKIRLINTAAVQNIYSVNPMGTVFGNIEINKNTTYDAVLLTNNASFDNLTLTNGSIDIGSYRLTINSNNIGGSGFGATKMVKTSGEHEAKGLRFNMAGSYTAASNVTFPIGEENGVTDIYSPLVVDFNATSTITSGSLNVSGIKYRHPAADVTPPTDTYDFYWKTELSSPFSISTNNVNFKFYNDRTYSTGKEVYMLNGTWYAETDNANVSSASPLNFAENFITGYFTAGKLGNFNGVLMFVSNKANGDWNTAADWTKIGTGGGTTPSISDVAVIQSNHHYSVTGTNIAEAAELRIYGGGSLDIGATTGHTLLIVSGGGKFKTSTNTLPTGDFDQMLLNDTAIFEFSGSSYTLPSSITNYPNLYISASEIGAIKTMPNADVLIRKNLIIGDGSFAESSLKLSGSANVTLNGNLRLYNSAKIILPASGTARTFNILGNIDMSYVTPSNNLFEVESSAGTSLTHIVNFYGDSLTTGQADMNLWKSNNTVANFYFKGSNSTIVTAPTGGTNSFDFNKVIIDKNLITDSVTFLNPFVFHGAANELVKPLQLDGGYCILNDPSIDTKISSGVYDFKIASDAALNLKNGKLSIDATGGAAKGLWLNGELKLEGNAQFIIGDSTTTNEQYIEYTSSGNSKIIIRDNALLNVNAQIRRSTTNIEGNLKYYQSGGTVRIHGYGSTVSRAKLEILNVGSIFELTGGTISLKKGGGSTTFGDLYIRPETSNATGGKILLYTNNTSLASETFRIDATAPLGNLYVLGSSGFTANAILNINPLSLNGSLHINQYGSFNTNNLNLSLTGNFENYGTFTAGTTDVTTLNGSVQNIYSSGGNTSFSSLSLNSTGSVTINIGNITVNKNLSILRGTFSDGGYNVYVKGNVTNYTTHLSPGAGGLILDGTSNQIIYGDGSTSNAVFGRVEVNNSADIKLNQNTQINNGLLLTNGSVNADASLLTINTGASLTTPTSFGINRMVYTNGFITNSQGLKMVIPSGSQEITFPIGVNGKYTPAKIHGTDATGGYLTIKPINGFHPTALEPDSVLQYYWLASSTGFSNFTGTLDFKYNNSDVGPDAPEDLYIAGRLYNNRWFKLDKDYVDEDEDSIHYKFTASSDISGEYSAGIDEALPTDVPVYYSTGSGNWDSTATWTPTPTGGVPSGAIMVVQSGHTVSITSDSKLAYRTTIDGTVSIDPGYVGHYFGIVYGTGTLKVASNDASIKLPAGNYTNFFSCTGGGLEYAGTGSYSLSLIPTILRRLTLSGSGSRILPNKDITICESLAINGTTTLDNTANNRAITLNGSITRTSGASFKSGSGANAIVTFSGLTTQNVGSATEPFTLANAFNHIVVNNPGGLTLNGAVDMKGNLTLTNGIISTTSSNLLYMNSGTATVSPASGSVSSYISGPLRKNITGGATFVFPIGKGTRYGNLQVRLPNDGSWTAEYFNLDYPSHPNNLAPLTAASDYEYWSLTGPAASNQAYVTLRWDAESDVRPAVTQNGITDMRIGQLNTSTNNWEEISSVPSGTDDSGIQESFAKITLPASGAYTRYLTNAAINPVKPRVRFTSTAPVCVGTAIPFEITGTGAYNYRIYYSVNSGANQGPITISSPNKTGTIPAGSTGTSGVYKLTLFEYNTIALPVANGVVDNTTVTVNDAPSNAVINTSNTSICVDPLLPSPSVAIDAVSPAIGTGQWSASGGYITDINASATTFVGTAGNNYTLTWTTTKAPCAAKTASISISYLASPPIAITSDDADNSYCAGTPVSFTASPPVGTSTYEFYVNNVGPAAGSIGNSWGPVTSLINNDDVTVKVTAINGCTSTSPGLLQRVYPYPTLSSTLTPADICSNTTFSYTPTSITLGATFNWNRAAIAGISNIAASGTNNPNELLVNTTSAPIIVTYVYTIAANGCSSVQNVTVTVNPAPAITDITQTMCSGTTFTVSPVDVTNGLVPVGTTYTWLIPVVTGGITGGSAQGAAQANISQTLTNPSGTSETATYTVTPYFSSCTGSAFTLTITVQSTPTSGVIAADQNINLGVDPNAFTSTTDGSGDGTISYRWEKSIDGGTIWNTIAGETNSTFDETSSIAVTTGYRRITTSTLNGITCESVPTAVITITVNPLPLAAGAITGATTVCQGDVNVSYSVGAITNATSYVWVLPLGASITSGSGTNSILVNYSNTASSGNVTVNGRNASGDGPASSIAVTVNKKPVSNVLYRLPNK